MKLDLRGGGKKSLADPPRQPLQLKSCDISSTRPNLLLVGGRYFFMVHLLMILCYFKNLEIYLSFIFSGSVMRLQGYMTGECCHRCHLVTRGRHHLHVSVISAQCISLIMLVTLQLTVQIIISVARSCSIYLLSYLSEKLAHHVLVM